MVALLKPHKLKKRHLLKKLVKRQKPTLTLNLSLSMLLQRSKSLKRFVPFLDSDLKRLRKKSKAHRHGLAKTFQRRMPNPGKKN